MERDGQLVRIPEADAVKLYTAGTRIYYMDGLSWGNLLKNTAERNGIIRQYEQYPCVKKAGQP